MSIRLIAKELYQIQQEKQQLEGRLCACPADQKDAITDLLRKKTAEIKHLKKMLEGAKAPPEYRRPL